MHWCWHSCIDIYFFGRRYGEVPFNSSMKILLARVVCRRMVWAVSSKVTFEPLRVVRLFLWLAAKPPLPVTPLNKLPITYGLVRCQTKVHNCKCSYLLWYFIVLLSKILLLIEFCFIISLIFLIFSPCPKYTSLGVRLSNDYINLLSL